MTQQLLNKTLLQIAGHLVIESDEQQRDFEQLYISLARTKLPTDKSLLINSDFSFERSDLFFTEAIPKSRLETLDRLVENQEDQRKPTFRVFVREVPVREQLIHGSVPTWAAGAKVSQSIGPFQNQDGRQFWYDFYAISKFIALYVQGLNEPVLLFRVATGRVNPGAVPSRLIRNKK